MISTRKIDFDFGGKTAIVTGAASGMGKLTAERFAECGANVVLTDVNAEAVEAAAAEIRANGGSAIGLVVDVRDFEQIEAAKNKTVEAYGSIDILVNCAGGASCRVNKIREPFKDFPLWALDWGIVDAEAFLPGAACKGEEFIAYLYAAKGLGAGSSLDEARVWADTSGVLKGLAEDLTAPCSRTDAVTLLYRVYGA